LAGFHPNSKTRSSATASAIENFSVAGANLKKAESRSGSTELKYPFILPALHNINQGENMSTFTKKCVITAHHWQLP
jgi:hypothetical protein